MIRTTARKMSQTTPTNKRPHPTYNTHSTHSKKSKLSSNDITTESLPPIMNIQANPHTIVLGTHPSKKSLAMTTKTGKSLKKFIRKRGGSGPQNYGNPNNSFWNIAGSFFDFRRDMTTYSEQTEKWKTNSFVLWDVVRSCSYKDNSSLDSKINTNTIQPNNILDLLDNVPSLTKIVFAKTAGNFFKKPQCFKSFLSIASNDVKYQHEWEFVIRTDGVASENTMQEFSKKWIKAVRHLTTLEIMEQQQQQHLKRVVEIIVCPSTSPANAMINSAEKEKIWHVACYGCTNHPAATYTCVACQKQGHHWLIDCPDDGYVKWCVNRKMEFKNSSVDPDNNGDRWYFSNPKKAIDVVKQ